MARRGGGLFTVAVATVLGAGIFATPARAGSAEVPRSVLQVIAHPDDDLLFMNPDLARDLGTGQAVTTVVLTAGEGRAGLADRHDVRGYVAERRAGLHAAYAAMARAANTWTTESVRSGGFAVEVHVLAARPGVRLAFLNLPDGRDPRSGLGRRSLARLLADRASRRCATTITPRRSPYAHCYTHDDVLGALVTLLRRYRPSVVRSQDPAPDRRYTADHTDHVAGARFAAVAVREYGMPVAEIAYRDYNLSDSPVNLDSDDRERTRRFFALYSAHDYRIHPGAPNYVGWQQRMRYRWPRGASWVAATPGGGLQAYAVRSGRLYTWWRTAAGWRGPFRLGGSALAPTLSVAGGRVFALRGRTIVAAHPRPSGDGWTAHWTAVGTGVTGAPVVVPGRGGRLVLFARNGEGGVSVKCTTAKGAWPDRWTRLPGPARRVAAARGQVTHGEDPEAPGARPRRRVAGGNDVQDGMDAVGGEAGVELFAPTRTHVLQWRQTGSCRFAYAGAVPGVRPAGPITATRDRAGHPTLVYEQAETVDVRQVKETGRSWSPPGTPLTAAFRRTGEAPVPIGVPAPPRSLGQPTVGVPMVATDDARRVSALALAADGRLYVSDRRPDGTFTPWRPAG